MNNVENKLRLIELKIQDNENILLASFGVHGLMKSQLKYIKIIEIISGLSGTIEDNIDLFFECLREFYYRDDQFKRFTTRKLDQLIYEERAWVMSQILSH